MGCRALTDEEVLLIKEKLPLQRDKTLFVLGLKTGLRISELLSIRIGDVYQHGRVVDRVKLYKDQLKGKERSREIMLHKDAINEIERLLGTLDSLDPEHFLFKSTVSQTQTNPNKAISRQQAHFILKSVVKELNLMGKIATHSTRKSFAWKFYKKSGHDLRSTQVALGHKFIETTTKYLDPDQKLVDSLIMDL